MTSDRRLRMLLVCSSGGHLTQLHVLERWWRRHDVSWVCFDTAHARDVLAGERVTWGHFPTTRNIPNMVRNAVLAVRLLRRDRPDLVVSTGAGVAFPFFLVAKALGIRTAYLEVYDRIDVPTLTGRLCAPFTDVFMLQWAEQQEHYPRGVVVGTVY